MGAVVSFHQPGHTASIKMEMLMPDALMHAHMARGIA